MINHKDKYLKKLSYILSTLVAISTIPLMLLGRYNHALGDDYEYGVFAKLALDRGGICDSLVAAWEGTATQYKIWQGTYSAMFLMHLPPHVFGDFFYKLYPTILLLCFTTGMFYLLKPIVCIALCKTNEYWRIISSVVVFLCLQQVPIMGEAFYWYNGSMYYTGFYALTLFFFGGVFRYLNDTKRRHIALLSLCGLFLAGGNYASLLPTLLILLFILAFLLAKKKYKKQFVGLLIITLSTMIGFIVSIIAPGNSARQSTSYGTTPVKAIIKSLLQGLSYLRGWSNIWLFLGLILLTPIFIMIIRDSSVSFKYPLIVIILAFGVFSSASCPTFFAQNNGGAARVFDISWYNMVLLVVGCYFYLLGWYIKKFDKNVLYVSISSIIVLFLLLAFIRPISETYIPLNSIKASSAIMKGEARYYEEQYQNRIKAINSPDKDLIFAPYDVPKSLEHVLYLGDMGPYSDDPVNRAFADFYNKNSVIVK